jgi:hypothetical protein
LKRAKREDRTGSAGYDKSSKSKPDFLDLDKDGNTEEPMKSAAKDMNKSSFQERFAEYSDDALRDMIVTLRRFDGTKDDIRELEQELDRRKQDKDNVNESILRNNLRRFGVKNLAENAFQGEPIQPEGDTVTAYQNKYDMVNLKVNGQMRQLLWLPMKKNLQQALDLAREEDAYLPTRDELGSLQKLVKTSETVGDIWIDQGNGAPANMRYVLFNLSDDADVVSNDAPPRVTVSDAVVLLRKTPMTGAVSVLPKP